MVKLRVQIRVVKRRVKPVLRGAFGQRGAWKPVPHGLLGCGKGAPSSLVRLMAELDSDC